MIRYFKYGYRGGRELNVYVGRWALRLARYQVALWRDRKAVVNFLDETAS